MRAPRPWRPARPARRRSLTRQGLRAGGALGAKELRRRGRRARAAFPNWRTFAEPENTPETENE